MRTDGKTDITKLVVDFRNFAKAFNKNVGEGGLRQILNIRVFIM
jgi:hypothetical protein